MNPAFSVIFLTTASGAGYGVLAWLGVLTALRLLPGTPSFGIAATLIALALSAAGLLASTFHLGHPERAWRAVSQWRTSWLSREGVLALFTNLPALGFALAWAVTGAHTALTIVLGLLAAVCALLTVASQAMIYATLKPIRQWCNGQVLPMFLALSLFSGATWLAGITAFWSFPPARLAAVIAVICAIVAMVLKLRYWRFIDASRPLATIESATGLGHIGTVRPLEAPHTEENYLLREMGYAIARKHRDRLRQIALAIGFIIPGVLLLLCALVGSANVAPLLPVSAVLLLCGVYVERWLFFAEATHTVTLYYGRTGR